MSSVEYKERELPSPLTRAMKEALQDCPVGKSFEWPRSLGKNTHCRMHVVATQIGIGIKTSKIDEDTMIVWRLK